MVELYIFRKGENMKKIICVFLLLCVIVVGGFLVFRFFYPSTGEKLSKKTYSVTELVPRTDELESGLCNKIEATYSDMSGIGKGERVTRSITDKESVDKIVKKLLGASYKRNNKPEEYEGGTHYLIVFYFSDNREPLEIESYFHEHIKINNKYYKFDNGWISTIREEIDKTDLLTD